MLTDKAFKTAKYGYLILSALVCIFGVVMIAAPGVSATLLCRIGGGLLLLFGCVKIIGYISRDIYRLAFKFDLAFGVLLVLLGIIMLFRTEFIIHVICTILGICILADALLKIQIALDSRSFGIRRWWLILCTAIITGIAGFLLILRPGESVSMLMVLLGISLLFTGIMNIITVISAVKIVEVSQPIIIDAEITE